MERKEDIRRFKATEIAERRARGESQTDLKRLAEPSTDETEGLANEQLIEDGMPLDWYETAQAVMPQPKKLVSLRLDSDVLDWFRQQGPGYQTRINAVLKSYIKHAPPRP